MAQQRLQIGEWWADPATNELGCADKTVRIEPKAMEVLGVLAGRAGTVVSREELLSAVWPGVVVGDEALTQSIIKLRRALGDNPRSPAYIETISKRGYRLIAPVRHAASSAARADTEPAALRELPGRKSPDTRALGLVAGVLLIAVTAGAYYFHSARQQTPPKGADISDFDEGRQPALPTVTVLPFESLGTAGEQTHLARGISNDLMTDLSRFSGFRLINASGATPSEPSAGSARYLISGSVQRESETLRINVRLIDTKTNEQLWAERFERPFRDLFAIQSDIVRRLTDLLPGKVSDVERQRLAKRYTHNLEAYEYFLRGQALFLVRRAEENEQARAFYRKALDLDPKFARAYAGLAMTYAMDYRLRPPSDSAPALARAFELAETARQIDPDIPEVYWALGFVHAQSRRHERAIESLQRAIELNRSYADAYAFMGGIYTYMGETAKSIPLLRTAMRLNPEGGYLYFLLLGRAYLFEGDIEQALINLREALARNPVDVETHIYLAAALAAAGDDSNARWEAEEIRSLQPGFSLPGWIETYPLTSTRHRERLLELLAKAGLSDPRAPA